jgi:membrane associated rhomboid family serine protease
MRSRYPRVSDFSYSFGPGPVTPAVKILLCVNITAFLVSFFAPVVLLWLGLRPADLIEHLAIWQLVTYMFLHGGVFHLLFNMLTLWMMGVELERIWGTRYFTRYYLATGLGAGVTQVLLGLLPLPFADQFYYQSTIGASGAIFGLLLAYGMYFPHRPIYMYFLFPVPARLFVIILGALSLLGALGGPGSGIAHTAHLGGLVAGYLYLKGGRFHPLSEIRYRYLKWQINRSRRKFDVYSGGRADDVNRRVH